MLTTGDAAQSCQGLTLATSHQQQSFAVGQIAYLLDRHKKIIGGAHVTQLPRLGNNVKHGAAQQSHLAAVL